MEEWPAHLIRFGLALVGGIAIGFAGRHGRFCTLGAIEDAAYGRDWTRLRAWALAAVVALLLTQGMAFTGLIDLGESVYVSTSYTVVAYVAGGLAFGFGMALVGTCGLGTLLRVGGGDLRALVTFGVIGLSAYAALRGVASTGRVALADGLPMVKAGALDASSPGWSATLAACALGAGLAAFALHRLSLAARPRTLVAGLVVGGAVAFGWWVTGVAGRDPMEVGRLESYTFVAPLGQAMMYAMTSSVTKLDFAHGAVLGVILGAFASSRVAGEFRWEAFDDAREMKRHLAGGVLMGIGGVTALGCTIGQGVTGLSTLSVGSMLATASILLGARFGLYWLIERPLRIVRPTSNPKPATSLSLQRLSVEQPSSGQGL